jgi:alkyldihydroxyacetonephosphate synthase
MTQWRTPPIAFGARHSELIDHLQSDAAHIDADLLNALAQICETLVDDVSTAEASRDWWPIAMHWALAGSVPKRPSVVAVPKNVEQVAAVVKLCHDAHVPLTASAGRSGVCGAAVPVFGGVVLDTTELRGVLSVDPISGVVEVLAGTFGPELEAHIQNNYERSVGHFPQSFDISTVGGWVACRGAGQYSTRYGKIEDMVVGLEVVLADGTIVRTGGAPATADGPDLTNVLIGSEGQLGIITRVWLRSHAVATYSRKVAFSFADFTAGINAIRETIQSGATPAVLRLYDAAESKRSHGMENGRCTLIVFDEGSKRMVDATIEQLIECVQTHGGKDEPTELVDRWFEHRNDTTALQALTQKGFVVDTMEVSAEWSRLPDIYEKVCAGGMAVQHSRLVSCHLSHSYLDGACLYFTFVATPPAEQIESSYVEMWNAVQGAALNAGASLSHHHGVGLNRARFAPTALGNGHDLLIKLKQSLDPHGIMNPGKYAIPSTFSHAGDEQWP